MGRKTYVYIFGTWSRRREEYVHLQQLNILNSYEMSGTNENTYVPKSADASADLDVVGGSNKEVVRAGRR